MVLNAVCVSFSANHTAWRFHFNYHNIFVHKPKKRGNIGCLNYLHGLLQASTGKPNMSKTLMRPLDYLAC